MNNYCPVCGDELPVVRGAGRPPKFCSDRCRLIQHRRELRFKKASANCNEIQRLDGVLILELFPGAGLFGRAFEALGATVVRGPDILWGGDVRNFHGTPGRFDGVIGGPPCQVFSRAAITGSSALNLIPEFVRIVNECAPTWAVMENVREARAAAPDWDYVFLRDWDCGGHTHRRRGFWFYGIDAPPAPEKRAGDPEYSVLASHWNSRGSNRCNTHLYLTPQRAAELQGFPALADAIIEHQPGWMRSDGKWDGVSQKSREVLATHMLGNGVPAALGYYVARWVAAVTRKNVGV